MHFAELKLSLQNFAICCYNLMNNNNNKHAVIHLTQRTLRLWSSPQDAISSLSVFWRKVILPHINFSRQHPTRKSLFGKGSGLWRDKVRKHSMAERWKLKRPSYASAWYITTRHDNRLFSARFVFLLPSVVKLQEIYCIYRYLYRRRPQI